MFPEVEGGIWLGDRPRGCDNERSPVEGPWISCIPARTRRQPGNGRTRRGRWPICCLAGKSADCPKDRLVRIGNKPTTFRDSARDKGCFSSQDTPSFFAVYQIDGPSSPGKRIINWG